MFCCTVITDFRVFGNLAKLANSFTCVHLRTGRVSYRNAWHGKVQNKKYLLHMH